MPEGCERDHEEIRRFSSDLKAALTGVERDLSALRRLIEALANALRDGAISFAGHDKGQSDMKSQVMVEIEAIRDRLVTLDDDLHELRRLQDEAKSAHEEFAELGEELQKNRTLLLELAGLTATLNPPPLARDLRQMIEMLRELTDRDPVTGWPATGWTLWGPKLLHAFRAGIAVALLALAYRFLAPMIPWAPAPHVSVKE